MASKDMEERRQSLICSLCLEVFLQPKLLPCSHTFCLECLVGLTSRRKASRKLSCPQCRRKVMIPDGGVSAFQNNFYLREDDLERARNEKLCLFHSDRELEFYCVQCDELICLSCKLTKHERHQTEDLHKAINRAKSEFPSNKNRLEAAIKSFKEKVDEVRKEKQAMQDKKVAVEKSIRNHHATVVAAADKFLDEALDSLKAENNDKERELSGELDNLLKNLDELSKFETTLEEAVTSETECKMLTVAKEMKPGGKIQTVLWRTQTRQRSEYVSRLVHRFDTATTAVVRDIRSFIGSVAMIDVRVSESDQDKIEEQFHCGQQDTDTEVFSLRPKENNKISVSYEMRSLREDFPVEVFNEQGKLLSAAETALAQRSYECVAYGSIGSEVQGQSLKLYPKSGPHRPRIWLEVDVSAGGGSVIKSTRHGDQTLFFLLGGTFRAFDVDDVEEVFVAVEEAKAPKTVRSVHLYTKPPSQEPLAVGFFKSLANFDRRGFRAADRIATYSPPTVVFQPSDVCFYRQNGDQLLMISDEKNDAIHVVDMIRLLDTERGPRFELSFLRYLAPGCPLLVQPTALNKDTRRRLWVACRGGKVLTITPKSQSSTYRYVCSTRVVDS